jgi:hypothetical protein
MTKGDNMNVSDKEGDMKYEEAWEKLEEMAKGRAHVLSYRRFHTPDLGIFQSIHCSIGEADDNIQTNTHSHFAPAIAEMELILRQHDDPDLSDESLMEVPE